MDEPLKDFLTISYNELEVLNKEAKKRRIDNFGKPNNKLESYYTEYLKKETRIKAVTVGFTDLEGKFQMLDYNKDYLLESSDNLTFDGSSVKGFTQVSESDLKLKLDWSSFYWLPSDIFGPGKVLLFAEIYTSDDMPHPSDFRSRLRTYLHELYKKEKYLVMGANEIEGILVEGLDAEMNFKEETGFKLVSSGGYYHSLPLDRLRKFIDATAEAHRALGFENEKDHPEVAPSQFELNYKHSIADIASDQVQLYKLVARQVAEIQGLTATFLPKPIVGINGSGMHTNLSIEKDGKNIFYEKNGNVDLSDLGNDFIDRILFKASAMCLILNPSVNAYRRLDPNFEAPNQIKASAVNRTAMVRIPLASEKSARIEVRSVAPDANPYMVYYTLLRVGLEGKKQKLHKGITPRTKVLPDDIYDAIKFLKRSSFMSEILGEETKNKYIALKQASADRCPKALGNKVKRSEVIFHHEITNQLLWNEF
ncbi:glutamine synthetase [Candidatus Dojkabacteria bacterium]|uniref:Glutamine synthetase n=1 Tax=Candidatus Dojkabacteria bacterium TaxID=2099670 RepID=A0A847ET55_9BACT|nr:glutamine synthetase [Candidatus Dojkabacteria bacterium]